jgi:hypothetical protein
MIDDKLLTLTCGTPSGVPFSISTTPIDLQANPDVTDAFQLIESTQRLIARFIVTQAFATANNANVQMYLVASSSSTFAAGNAILAAATGPLEVYGSPPTSTYFYGYKAAQLTLGTTIDVPIASINNAAQAGVSVKSLRYLGAGLSIPNYAIGTTLTAGTIECRIVSDAGLSDSTKLLSHFNSGMKVV